MHQRNYIDPNLVPRPTGAARQDAEAMYRFLYNMTADLSYRLSDIERRIRKLEKAQED